MTKDVFNKITTPFSPLSSDELLVSEKKVLMDFFASKGLLPSTFYLRFFQKGFSIWEIIGVNECKKQFLRLSDVAKILSESAVANVDILMKSEGNGVFYENLRKVGNGLCGKFFSFMQERGMSTNTVIKRFKNEDWKPWEIDGVKTMLEPYIKE